MKDFGVELISVDGNIFSQPVDFITYEVPKSLKLVKLYSQPDKVIQDLGMSYLGYTFSTFPKVKKTFESNFLHRYKFGKYRLVYREWDPVEAGGLGKKEPTGGPREAQFRQKKCFILPNHNFVFLPNISAKERAEVDVIWLFMNVGGKYRGHNHHRYLISEL